MTCILDQNRYVDYPCAGHCPVFCDCLLKWERERRGISQKTGTVEEALKPCPFCGGKPFSKPQGLSKDYKLPKQSEPIEHYDVRCQLCSASAGTRSTPKKAIEAWNKRV